MEGLTVLDDAWTRWFARETVKPLRLTYEALASDPRGTLAHVLSALGLNPTLAAPVEVPNAKLADAISGNRATSSSQNRQQANVHETSSRPVDGNVSGVCLRKAHVRERRILALL